MFTPGGLWKRKVTGDRVDNTNACVTLVNTDMSLLG